VIDLWFDLNESYCSTMLNIRYDEICMLFEMKMGEEFLLIVICDLRCNELNLILSDYNLG